MVESPPPQFLKTIEWDMMDKTKFVPLSMLSSFSVRCALYPLTLIKTRLQIQKHNDVYSGTFDAYYKIFKYEGFSGLYRGFWVSSVQIVSGVFYISTYEGVRHVLSRKEVNSKFKALVAGGFASLVSQTIIVPFDVISQHLMMLGCPKSDYQEMLCSIFCM
ncbi:solute carrier family 25 member 44 isoform X2 [Agrilus planipennis]|uniref:Solute carrier family 25 member 44 isoform X2 n=1 Tax=Agrilus planipennis TaxID=224129 RepID=A0A7F5R9W7_AGRPL|nr:solute carrier family 25 member 44 isoform X2 [Agrilus planipennis]